MTGGSIPLRPVPPEKTTQAVFRRGILNACPPCGVLGTFVNEQDTRDPVGRTAVNHRGSEFPRIFGSRPLLGAYSSAGSRVPFGAGWLREVNRVPNRSFAGDDRMAPIHHRARHCCRRDGRNPSLARISGQRTHNSRAPISAAASANNANTQDAGGGILSSQASPTFAPL